MAATPLLLACLVPTALQEGATWRHEGGQAGAELGRTLAAGDLNGDGFGDLVVGAPLFDGARGVDSGRVSVFLGSAAGLAAVADWSSSGERPRDRFGSALAVLDLDGDGCDDLCVGAPDHDRRAGRALSRAALGHAGPALASDEGAVYAFLGSPAGLAATPQRVVLGIEAGERLGSALAPVDTNGDALVDLLVGAPGKLQGRGGVLLFPGTPAGLHGLPAWLRVGASAGEEYGRVFGSIGDQDGDGDEELVVSVPLRFATGTLELFRGSPSGPGATPDRLLARRLDVLGTSGDLDADGVLETLHLSRADDRAVQWRELFAGTDAGAFPPLAAPLTMLATGDLDGDGRANVVGAAPSFVYGPYRGRVWCFASSAGETLAPSVLAVLDGEQDGAGWGAALATLDVDGDGADELVVSAPGHDAALPDEGLVTLFPGRKAAFRQERRAVPLLDGDAFRLGVSGDFDHDGFDDLIHPLDRRTLAVRYGSSAGLPSAPDGLLLVPDRPGWLQVTIELEPGDFDGDGHADVVASLFPFSFGAHGEEEQLLFRGSAQGLGPGFAGVASGFGHTVAAGDVNGDGRDDVLIRRETRVDLHLGESTGLSSTAAQSFPNPFGSLLPCDLDGDPYGDVLGHREIGGHCILFRGSPAGLGVQAGLPAYSPRSVLLDVDGDGDDDLVTEHPLATYLATGGALLPGTKWWDGSAADFHRRFDADGDGWNDLWVEGDRLHLGSPAGLERMPAWSAPASGALQFHVEGDFDGDGCREFLVDLGDSYEWLELVRLGPGARSSS